MLARLILIACCLLWAVDSQAQVQSPGTGSTGGTSQADNSAVANVTGAGALYDATPPAITDGNVGLPRMSSTRILLIDGSGATQPISGTVTSNAGTGTFLVGDGAGALNVICDSGCSGGSQYVEDAASAGGENLTLAGAIRQDTIASSTTLDGDYANLKVNSVGRLYTAATIDAALPTGANVIGALSANQSVNTAQINGVTTLMGNGVTGTGSQRVTIASDNTAFSVNIGTFPDNEPINVAQINGVTALMGNGVTGTGSQRVTIASDNTAFSVNVGTFPDNEPINVAQMNGVAVTMGNGVADTGVQRVAIASDNTAFSVNVGTFPDNEPINVAQVGGTAVVAGACETEQPLYIQISQAAGAQLITGTASERVYICSLQIVTATAQNIALVDGTGTVCATAATGLLGGATAATGWNLVAGGGLALSKDTHGWTKTSTDADNVCLLQSSTGQISGSLSYVSRANM